MRRTAAYPGAMRRLSALLIAAALPLAACGSSPGAQDSTNAAECPPAEGTAQRVTTFSAPPPMCIDPSKTYTATMTTDAGPVTIELLAKKAPKTVNNFVVLARNHYYDGVTFHRVIQGFMAQGGDPAGTGNGGPGYTIEDEPPAAGEYQVGSVAMARTKQPNSGGSQFFIITGDAGVQLPPQYSLFGKVTQGMDAVKKIEADGSPGDEAPAKVHTITKVTITEK